ncbi:MAG: hypothetical protein J6Y08_05390 [Clostridiales bacterium]|nr:hypothetical protein [Clostridiales bacterium]
MKLVNLTCPNCGGNLVKEGDNLICQSCGGAFSIDYDDADVEHEKLQTEAERDARRLAHEKELLEKQYELEERARIDAENRQFQRTRQVTANMRGARIIFFVITALVMCTMIFVAYQMVKGFGSHGRGFGVHTTHSTPTPTPAPNYNVSAEDFKDKMNDFIEAGKTAQMNIDQCTYLPDGLAGIRYYDKVDAVFMDAYLITDIPEKPDRQSNRLVLVYQVTWHNDDHGDQVCYDAVYFEGIRVNPNGGIISDYSPRTIIRSDAAWGWAMAYSFEEYDQCYRENVAALGGTVVKIEI